MNSRAPHTNSRRARKHNIYMVNFGSLLLLYIIDFVVSKPLFRSQAPVSLADAIRNSDCPAIYSHSVLLFKQKPKMEQLLADYLNTGSYSEACLVKVLDAYYEQVMEPEWKKTLTPLAFSGKLTSSAAIPNVSFPLPAFTPQRSKSRLQIIGQSKTTGAAAKLHTGAGHWNFGEDAAGASQDFRFFIVADGVGGSSHSETVSRSLVYLSLRLYKAGLIPDLLAASTKLLNVLQLALKRFSLTGSSTYLAAFITKTSAQIVNVGDCQAILIDANGNIKVLTEEQWYEPNAPYQLNAQSVRYFKPDMAGRYEVKVNAGDRLLLYSDGIADNVWPRQVVRVGSAEGLLTTARRQAAGTIGVNIPFSRKMGRDYAGKMDDMTVIWVNV